MTSFQSLDLPLGQIGPADFLRSRLGRSFVPEDREENGRYPFGLRHIGALRGWPVALCEARPGRHLPEYEERRRWRSGLDGASKEGILVYSDAAHSGFVWSWFES